MKGCTCIGKSLIEQGVDEANAECSMTLGDGLTVTAITMEDDWVVYNFFLDEQYLGVTVSEFNDPYVMGAMKMVILYSLQNSGEDDADNLISLCKSSNVGITMRFQGDTTGEVVDIVIDAGELWISICGNSHEIAIEFGKSLVEAVHAI